MGLSTGPPSRRSSILRIFNALEVALSVKESYGGTVTAITMGPPKAGEVLRECLYRGADQGVS